jgi:hypothetical protein
MVDGRGIYMSLPNLTQFEVKFKHGLELESVITLEPKTTKSPQTLTAQTFMTSDYPVTDFRTCPWWGCSEEVLVNIDATLKFPNKEPPELHIDGFYSKAADTEAAPFIEPRSEEDFLLRGAGRRLLCLMLDTLQWKHTVTLDASGLSYRDEVVLRLMAEEMQEDDIMANLEEEMLTELKDLNPNMLEQWKTERLLNMGEQVPLTLEDQEKKAKQDLDDLRNEWVSIRGNQNLVVYYMNTFGFKPVALKSLTFVGMEATPEMIHERCQANAEKDRDCAEIILSREVADAVSQTESLRKCKNIRMLYLHGVQALPIVGSLLPVTQGLGLLGLTSLFALETIEQLLTTRQRLTVQIDCLCLDRSNWSMIAHLAESEVWPRLFIRSVVATSFDGTEGIYDDVMNALQWKTGAIYHKVSGVLPHYMDTKVIDHAVRVKGEEMTEVGSRLYNDAGTKINSGPIV